MNFSDGINERLKAKGWSQAELARRASISKAGLCNALKGESNIDLPRLIKIAKALNTNVWKLVKEAESKS